MTNDVNDDSFENFGGNIIVNLFLHFILKYNELQSKNLVSNSRRTISKFLIG